MSKPVKDLITQEYKKVYRDLDSACVVSVIGLDAISTNKLRGELRQKEIRLQVIKNSMARRALADTTLGPLSSALEGPCALVTGGSSVIDVAKLLVDFQKTYPQLELKIGMLDGDPELIDLKQLAKMKSREELIAEVAMLISSPARNIAGCLAAAGGRLAGCIKAIAEKQEGSEAA